MWEEEEEEEDENEDARGAQLFHAIVCLSNFSGTRFGEEDNHTIPSSAV